MKFNSLTLSLLNRHHATGGNVHSKSSKTLTLSKTMKTNRYEVGFEPSSRFQVCSNGEPLRAYFSSYNNVTQLKSIPSESSWCALFHM